MPTASVVAVEMYCAPAVQAPGCVKSGGALSNIASHVFEALGLVARVIDLPAGEVLVVEGQEAHDVFYLESGRLIASTGTPHGEVDVGVIHAGDLAGEVPIVAGGTRTATLRAEHRSVVLAIPRGDFERWLDDHSEFAIELAAQARERIDRRQVAVMVTGLIGVADAELVRQIVDRVEWCRLEPGEVLFRRGDRSDAVYLILGGRVLVEVGSGDVANELARELGRGEVIGELGLLDRAPRSATVRAVRDTTLARFSSSTFEALVVEHPLVMLGVLRGLVDRLRRPPARLIDRASTVTIAITAPVDPAPIVAGVCMEIACHGTVQHLTSERVDALLNRADIAQVAADSAGAPRLAELMHEVDVSNDHVLLEVDRDMTAWTRRALRQADRVVLVVSAVPDASERRRIHAVLDGLAGVDPVRTLAVLQPAHVERPSGTGALMRQFGAHEVVHLRAGSAPDVARLGRLVSGHGVGLVLGGGGARGFAHLGAYRALRACGVMVDRIGGASIGAPIGAGIALDLPLDELDAAAETQFHRLLDYTLPVVSLIKGGRMSRNILATFGDADIEDLWLGFYCVSTNLTTSRLHVHEVGNLARAIRASTAIPGILPPVPADDGLLVDGGVLDNLPIAQMRGDGRIGTVIAVDVAPTRGPRSERDYGMSVSGWRALGERMRRRTSSYPSMSGVLLRSMITGALRTQQDAMRNVGVDLLLDLHLPGVGLLDFERVRPVAQAGYDAALPYVTDWAASRQQPGPRSR